MVVITIFIIILVYSLPFIKNTISTAMFRRISAISLIYAGVLILSTLNFQSIGSGIGIYSGLFQVNILSNIIAIFLLFISSLILLVWPISEVNNNLISPPTLGTGANLIQEGHNTNENKLKIKYHYIDNNQKSNEYCLIIFFNILGALFLLSSSDLVSMYLSIELQSFGLYILATLYKEKYSSTSAGLKYFLLGGLSSCIILLGSGLVYSYTGLTNFESIYSVITVGTYDTLNNINNLNNYINNIENIFFYNTEIKGISIGILFIFSGFLFKIAASPFHNWAPDVYDDSPTLVTIWLTIMPKISILIFLLQLQIGVDLNLFILSQSIYIFNTSISNISLNVLINLLLLSSLLSLLIGSIVGLSQTRIKRLLAYSTISHIGFLLLSLSVFSNISIEAFIFYIIQYTITNLNIFLIILAFGYLYRVKKLSHSSNNNGKYSNTLATSYAREEYNLSDIEYISGFKGLFYKNPLLSISFSICLFSFAGIPPLIGFFAKQQVLYSSNAAGYFFLSLIAILVSVISAFYYLKIIKILHSLPLNSLATRLLPIDDVNNSQNAKEENKLINEKSKLFKSLDLNKDINFLNNNFNQNYKPISTIHSLIISILTLFILLFIFNPEIILNCIAIISSLILNL